MAEIETTYRGHCIRYSENSDEWTCYDIGTGFSNVSLQKVKARIDKMYLDLRKKAATPCFELSTFRGIDLTESTVIEYIGPKWDGGGWSNSKRQIVDHKVACVAQRSGRSKASRQEVELSYLVPNTPEALAAVEEAKAAHEKVRAAEAAYWEAAKRIPRLTLDDVAELVRLKESDAEAKADD